MSPSNSEIENALKPEGSKNLFRISLDITLQANGYIINSHISFLSFNSNLFRVVNLQRIDGSCGYKGR